MEKTEKKNLIPTSLMLDEETLTYLDEERKKEQRSRSAMLRVLLRKHIQLQKSEPATSK